MRDEDLKAIAGAKKDPMHLLPPHVLRSLARVMALGARRYGEFNWRGKKLNTNVYSAAMMRHLLQFMDGEDVDEESGESHLSHIMATCTILLDARACGNLVDDRFKKP